MAERAKGGGITMHAASTGELQLAEGSEPVGKHTCTQNRNPAFRLKLQWTTFFRPGIIRKHIWLMRLIARSKAEGSRFTGGRVEPGHPQPPSAWGGDPAATGIALKLWGSSPPR
jgi:hypothetical protein